MKTNKIKRTGKVLLIILAIFFLFGFITNNQLASAQYQQEDLLMYKIENSKQYKDGKFHNVVPWNATPGASTMWDFFFKNNQRTPEDNLPRIMADLSNYNSKDQDQLNSTWLGHSTLLINIDGLKIITDPVFPNRASIFGPTRFNGEIPVDIEQLNNIDVVLISHNHYDHLNKASIKHLISRTKLFVVPLGVGAQLEKWDVPREKIRELDWWDEIEVAPGFKIASTPSQHFSGRGLTDRNKTLWTSYVVIGKTHKIYFSGDSGYFEGFKKIGDVYGPFNMTFLECGAYNLAWEHVHMLPEQTAQAHLDLKGDLLHPIHWGTFNLSLHSWFEPMQRLTKVADSLGIRYATPIVGGSTIYDTQIPVKRWWDEVLETNNQNLELSVESAQ